MDEKEFKDIVEQKPTPTLRSKLKLGDIAIVAVRNAAAEGDERAPGKEEAIRDQQRWIEEVIEERGEEVAGPTSINTTKRTIKQAPKPQEGEDKPERGPDQVVTLRTLRLDGKVPKQDQ